jgi:hypothetical protein
MTQRGTQHVNDMRGVRGGRGRPDTLRQRRHPGVQPGRDGEPGIVGEFRRLTDEVLAGLLGGVCAAEPAPADALTAEPDREVPGTMTGIGCQPRAVVAVAAAGGGIGAAAPTVDGRVISEPFSSCVGRVLDVV